MKVILCLCLIAPLVFGSSIPAELDVDIQAFESDVDIIEDLLKAPTEEQKKCIQEAIKKVVDANPDLDWWFNDLKGLAEKVKAQYEKCKSIDKEPEQKKCLLKLKVHARIHLFKIIKSLPKDKKEVLTQLRDGIKECLE